MIKNESCEKFYIFLTDTVSYPGTVMIEKRYAFIANFAVFRTSWFIELTRLALVGFSEGLSIKIIFVLSDVFFVIFLVNCSGIAFPTPIIVVKSYPSQSVSDQKIN